jgi:nitroreductase
MILDMEGCMTAANERRAARPIDPLFLERWSPRAFDGTPIRHDDLMTIFEAARWAPSSFNVQPWRFLYAHRDTPAWPIYLDLLIPFNASWAHRSSVLVIIISDSLMPPSASGESKTSHSHSFDAGAAWGFLALQASLLGYQAHGMAGFDIGRTRKALGVPERYRIEAAVAIGRPTEKSILPKELQSREAPSNRKPISDFVFEGSFPAS